MSYVLIGGTVIDGTGSPPRRDMAVVVNGSTITSIGPKEEVSFPSETEVLQVDGKTIIPGMIDTHIHLCGDASLDPLGPISDLIPLTAIRAIVAARELLEFGFTTCRDLGAIGYANVAAKQAIEQHLVPGPRLIVCGEMVMSVGSGEDSYFRPELSFPRTGVFCGVDEARGAVRTQIYHGADVIKLIASGRVGSNAPSMPWDSEMTREEIAAVADEAHRWGKRVAAHAYSSSTVTDCILAGVDTIEHGALIDEATIALMAESDTYLVPTLSAFHSYLVPGAESRYPAYRLERGRMIGAPQMASFHSYMDYGIKIAVGSDGIAPGRSAGTTALELELLVNAGMSPMQAIESATRVGAEALGVSDRLGTLQPGKVADIVVIDGDPLSDIRLLQEKARVLFVMKDGHIQVSNLIPPSN